MFRRDLYTIHRTAGIAGGKQYASTGVVLSGQLDPVGAEYVAIADGAYGKVHAFTTQEVDVDVKIGDRLVGDAGTFEVKGVQVSRRQLPVMVIQLLEPAP